MQCTSYVERRSGALVYLVHGHIDTAVCVCVCVVDTTERTILKIISQNSQFHFFIRLFSFTCLIKLFQFEQFTLRTLFLNRHSSPVVHGHTWYNPYTDLLRVVGYTVSSIPIIRAHSLSLYHAINICLLLCLRNIPEFAAIVALSFKSIFFN